MIVLATPTRESITAATVGDIVRVCRDPNVKFLATLGIYIAALRQQAIHIAQHMRASHILFVDSDMRFPEDTVPRLLQHDRDIVAANCVQRTAPNWWNSRLDGRPISSESRSGLQEVDTVSFGVILIKLSVFDDLDKPWFDTPYDGQSHVGEDIYFCREARKAGFRVWIDHDLSQLVRHRSAFELGVEAPQHVLAVA